jgi:heme biosynthesis-associated TPR repeat protein
VLYLLLRFLVGLRRAPQRLQQWEQRRKALRARNALNRGLIELAEGDWPGAEKRLLKHAADSETPLLNYLAAARAAQQQGAHERRDHYLRLAHQGMPDADIAVGLTQAELQIAHRQMEQALATLTHLRTLAPRHGYVLKMLMRLYERLHDWEHLRDLLPELRKRKVLDAGAAERLEIRLHGELLAQAARGGDMEALRDAWNRVPRRLLHNPDLVLVYATQLKAWAIPRSRDPAVLGAEGDLGWTPGGPVWSLARQCRTATGDGRGMAAQPRARPDIAAGARPAGRARQSVGQGPRVSGGEQRNHADGGGLSVARRSCRTVAGW